MSCRDSLMLSNRTDSTVFILFDFHQQASKIFSVIKKYIRRGEDYKLFRAMERVIEKMKK